VQEGKEKVKMCKNIRPCVCFAKCRGTGEIERNDGSVDECSCRCHEYEDLDDDRPGPGDGYEDQGD
jgi:hypothetical protein